MKVQLYLSEKCPHTRIIHRRGEIGHIQCGFPGEVDCNLMSVNPFLILSQGGRDVFLRGRQSTHREGATEHPIPG